MAHPLEDFRLKLNRADQHLEVLKHDVEAWFKRQPYGVTGKYEAGPPEQYVLYFRMFEPLPKDWGLLIGEFAHNARSALDYLAWQLVLANNGKPSRRTQFPIVLNPCAWINRSGAGRLHGASRAHIAAVERLQPYNRVDSDGWSYSRRMFDHPLTHLQSLNNEDKHRVLPATLATIQSIGWDVVGAQDVALPLSDLGSFAGKPLEDGAPLMHIPVVAVGPNPQLEVEFTERMHITVGYRVDHPDGGWTTWTDDLLENLGEIASELRRIFRIFVREFV